MRNGCRRSYDLAPRSLVTVGRAVDDGICFSWPVVQLVVSYFSPRVGIMESSASSSGRGGASDVHFGFRAALPDKTNGYTMPDPPPKPKPKSTPPKARKPRKPKNPYMCKTKSKLTGKVRSDLYSALKHKADQDKCRARIWPFD